MASNPARLDCLIDEPLLEMVSLNFIVKINHRRFKRLYSFLGGMVLINCILGFVYLARNFEYFTRYLPSIFVSLGGLLNIPFILDSQLYSGIRILQRNLWPLDIAGDKLKRSILRQYEVIKHHTLLTNVLFGMMALMVLPYSRVMSDAILPLKLADDFCGNWALLCKTPYVAAVAFFIFLTSGFCGTTIYYMGLIRTQHQLLNGVLSNISKNVGFYRDSDAYQEEIHHRLKFCIVRHIELRRMYKSLGVVDTWPVICYFFCWSLVLVSEWILIINNYGLFMTVMGLLEMIPTAGVTVIFLITGQSLKDVSLNLYEIAARSPYYDWNKKNRDALQMLMIHSSYPMKICSYNMLVVEYALFIRMSKVVYNLVMMLQYIEMRNKINH